MPQRALGWSLHYPLIADAERTVKFLDVGMGFGGLTVALAELYPEKLVIGMEIRAKVCQDKLSTLRSYLYAMTHSVIRS
jgi:tRNA (guanine-N7-)-methyltransferase